MKINRNLLAALSLTVVLSASAMAAVAQQQDHTWIQQRVAKHIVARIEGRLNLTTQQREQAKAILLNERAAILTLTERTRKERDELANMPAFNEAQVREVAARHASDNADILVERTKVRMELRAILNDAQRQQLDQLRGRFGSHIDERINDLAGLL